MLSSHSKQYEVYSPDAVYDPDDEGDYGFLYRWPLPDLPRVGEKIRVSENSRRLEGDWYEVTAVERDIRTVDGALYQIIEHAYIWVRKV